MSGGATYNVVVGSVEEAKAAFGMVEAMSLAMLPHLASSSIWETGTTAKAHGKLLGATAKRLREGLGAGAESVAAYEGGEGSGAAVEGALRNVVEVLASAGVQLQRKAAAETMVKLGLDAQHRGDSVGQALTKVFLTVAVFPLCPSAVVGRQVAETLDALETEVAEAFEEMWLIMGRGGGGGGGGGGPAAGALPPPATVESGPDAGESDGDGGGGGGGGGDVASSQYVALSVPAEAMRASVEATGRALVGVGKDIGRLAVKVLELGVDGSAEFMVEGSEHPYVQLSRKMDGMIAEFVVSGTGLLTELSLVAPTVAAQELGRLQGTLEGTVKISAGLNGLVRQFEGAYHTYKGLKGGSKPVGSSSEGVALIQSLTLCARKIMDAIASTTFEDIDTSEYTAEVRGLIQEYARSAAGASGQRSAAEEDAHVNEFIEQLVVVIRNVVGEFEIALIDKINEVLVEYPHLVAIVDHSAASGSDSASTIERVVRKWLYSNANVAAAFGSVSSVDFFASWVDGRLLAAALGDAVPGLAEAVLDDAASGALLTTSELTLNNAGSARNEALMASVEAVCEALGRADVPFAPFGRLLYDASVPVVDPATRWGPLRTHCLTAVLLLFQVHALGHEAIKAQLDVVRHEHVSEGGGSNGSEGTSTSQTEEGGDAGASSSSSGAGAGGSGGASASASHGAAPPKLNLGPLGKAREGRRPSLADGNSPRLNADSIDDAIVQASVAVLHAAKKLVVSGAELLKKGKELHVALVTLRDLILRQVKLRASPEFGDGNKRVQRRCNVLFDSATELLKACKANAAPEERKTIMSGMADAIGAITKQQMTVKTIRGLARSALVLAKQIKNEAAPNADAADSFAAASAAFVRAVTARAVGFGDAVVRGQVLDLLDDVEEKASVFSQAAVVDVDAARAQSDVYSSALASLLVAVV